MEKYFKDFSKKNKIQLSIYSFFLLSYNPIEIFLFCYVMVLFYDRMGKKQNLNKLGLLCCFLFFLVYLNRILKKYFEKNLVPELLIYLRKGLYTDTIESIKKNFKEVDIGGIMTSFVFISSSLKNIIFNLFSTILPKMFTIIFMTIFIVFCNPLLGKITIVYFIMVSILIYLLIKKCQKICYKKIKQFETNNSKIEDSLKNISTIIIKSDKDKDKDIQEIENSYKKKYIHSLDCSLQINILFSILLILYFIICIYIVIKYQKNKETYIKISCLVIISYIASFSGYLFDQIPVLMNDYELLRNTKKYYNNILKQNLKKKVFQNSIQLKNIYLSIDNKKLFNNLNLEIKKNDKIIISGESGTGKSTLMKLLLGFNNSSYKGNYYIDGININNIDIDYLRNQINYCEQQAKLFNMSVLYNINYGINIKESDIINFINKYNIKNLKSIIREKKIGPNSYKISGGQKQMINIVRCFLKKKKLIFMDEPSANLDDYHFNILIKLINETKTSTIIIITHDKRFEKIKYFTKYKLMNKNITKI